MNNLKNVLLAIAITLLAFSSASAEETIKVVSWMLVDKTGKQLDIDSKYFPVGHFSEGLIVCAKQIGDNYKFGYMDRTGKVIIEPRFSRARTFSCGVGIVEDNFDMSYGTGEFSLMDKSGKLIRKFAHEEVDNIWDFSEGLAVVRRYDSNKKAKVRTGIVLTTQAHDDHCRYGFCDTNGKTQFFENIDKLFPLSQGLALATVDDKYGFANASGKLVIAPTYRWANSFSEGLAAVSDNGKTGFIDKSGKVVFELKFDRVGAFSEGLAPFQIGGKWGFVDTKGNVVIQPQYAVVADGFHGGIAACAIEKKKLPNSRMEFSQGEYNETPVAREHETKDPDVPLKAGDFFRSQLRFGLIDKTGKFVIAPVYWNIGRENDGLRMIISTTGGHGFIDRSGKEVIEPKYRAAGKFADGSAVVSQTRLPQPNYIEIVSDQDLPYQPSQIVSHTPMHTIEPALLEENLAACSEACVFEPNNPKLLRQLAWFYFALNMNKEAIDTYQKTIELSPNNSELRQKRAEVFLRLKRWKEAEDDATESIKLSRFPNENGIYGIPMQQYVIRGIARLKQGNIEGAMSDLLDNYCMGDFKDRKLVSDKGIPNSCRAVLDVVEAAKDYDTAATVWERLYHDENSMPPVIEYPPTLPQLKELYRKAEHELDDVTRSNEKHPYLKQRKSYLAAELLTSIILREEARYRSSETEKKLLRLIELRKNVVVPVPKFEGKPNQEGYVSVPFSFAVALEKRVDWGRAKYWLMKYYAEQRDKRCEEIYKELMVDTTDMMNWRSTASAVYANYLLEVQRVDEAEKILNFGMEKYPTVQIVRAKAKFLNSKGLHEEANKLLEHSLNPVSGGYLPGAPMPDEDSDAEGFLELSRTCKDLGLFNSSLFYLKKAEGAAVDENSKALVANYKKYFMTISEKIDLDAEVLFQRVFIVGPKTYIDPSELELCARCVEKSKNFAPAYLRWIQILREVGDYSRAKEFVAVLTEKLPESIDVLIEKARLHACLKEIKEAKAIYDKILSIDPENSAAKRELEIIK